MTHDGYLAASQLLSYSNRAALIVRPDNHHYSGIALVRYHHKSLVWDEGIFTVAMAITRAYRAHFYGEQTRYK